MFFRFFAVDEVSYESERDWATVCYSRVFWVAEDEVLGE